MPRRLAAILAADVVGFSKLMGEDEAGTLAALKDHRRDLFDPETQKRGGRIVKLMGDGALVEFPSVVDAVEAALAIQRGLLDSQSKIRLRIGINLGDVIIDGDDIYGDGVNVAARLEALADPGGIAISGMVREGLGNSVEITFSDDGVHHVKNIERPIRIYRWNPETMSMAGADNSSLRDQQKPSIAILPFNNLSGDPEQEYFSDGITEDIITDLSRVSQLFVIARNSSFSYKGRALKAQQISADLGAKFLVEGSVRKAGNRVRVTTQLIDGQSGGHLWAERYDRDLTDVFQVQDDIAKNIVAALKVAIAPSERRAIERVPTRSLEAYDFYLRGRQFLNEMNSKKLELAREMFLEAVQLDPEYALAFTGLADCDAVLYNWYSSNREHLESAIRNCKEALRLEPDLAEAHASMGFAHTLNGDEPAAVSEFNAALAIDPMLYEAYWYFGLTKVLQGELDIAAQMFSKATQVRGEDLQSKMMLMSTFHGMGRQKENLKAAKETFAIAERRLNLDPQDSRAAYIGAVALIHLNERTLALEWTNKAAQIDSSDTRTTYNLACAYSLLGEIDKALDYLELTINSGRPIRMMQWARIDPDLTNARENPRFDALLKQWQEDATV